VPKTSRSENLARLPPYSAAEKGISLEVLFKASNALIHYRQFAEDLGFPQTSPSGNICVGWVNLNQY